MELEREGEIIRLKAQDEYIVCGSHHNTTVTSNVEKATLFLFSAEKRTITVLNDGMIFEVDVDINDDNGNIRRNIFCENALCHNVFHDETVELFWSTFLEKPESFVVADFVTPSKPLLK
jgi:hypothetical protein